MSTPLSGSLALGRSHTVVLSSVLGVCLPLLTLASVPSTAAASPAVANTAPAAASRTLYVAPWGSDSASGYRSRPLRHLKAAIGRARAGDRILLRRGIYHEDVEVRKPRITIAAYPGERPWMDGSRRVTGWRASRGDWVRDNWHYEYDNSPSWTPGGADGDRPGWQWINPRYPMAAHPEQIWVNGRRLRQVKTRSQVRPGRFAVDYAANKLIIGSNPRGTVRASILSRAIAVRARGVSLRGFGVRRYATAVSKHGAITLERPRTSMRRMTVIDNATSGLGVSADGITVSRSTFARNGLIGVHGSHSYGLRLVGLRVLGNNLEHFNQAPVSGGIKIGRTRGLVVRDSVVSGNHSTAVWFDESTYNTRVINNRITGNRGHGIHLEISQRSLVANNQVARNGGAGIQVVDTGNVRLWNNTVVSTGRPINIIQDKRTHANAQSGHDKRRPFPDPTVPWRVEGVWLRNNVIADPRRSANCLLCVEDGTHKRSAAQMGIHPNGNVYQRRWVRMPRWLIVWSRGVGSPRTFKTMREFRGVTRRERRGVFVRRGALHGAAPTYKLRRWSRARAVGMPGGVAAVVGVRRGTKRLGVLLWRLP